MTPMSLFYILLKYNSVEADGTSPKFLEPIRLECTGGSLYTENHCKSIFTVVTGKIGISILCLPA